MKPIFLTVAMTALASALFERSTDANSPQTLDRVWSGVKQSGSGFTSVTGTFTVPKGGKSFGPSIWVGIDGSTECPGGGLLQTGVRLTGNGTAFGWFEWVPLSAPVFEGFAVSEGDDVRMTVHAYGPFNGSAILENLSTGQTVSHTLTSADAPPDAPLCQKSVEWIVEDYNNSGGNDTGIVASPDYGTITIRNASAQGSAGTITPEGGELILRSLIREPVLSYHSALLGKRKLRASMLGHQLRADVADGNAAVAGWKRLANLEEKESHVKEQDMVESTLSLILGRKRLCASWCSR